MRELRHESNGNSGSSWSSRGLMFQLFQGHPSKSRVVSSAISISYGSYGSCGGVGRTYLTNSSCFCLGTIIVRTSVVSLILSVRHLLAQLGLGLSVGECCYMAVLIVLYDVQQTGKQPESFNV